jgi:hypothetical protein
MPRSWNGVGWNDALNLSGVRYTNELGMSEQTIHHTKELLISEWTLPASQAGGYQELVSKMRTNVTIIFAHTFLGRLYPGRGGPLGLSQRQWLRWVWFALWGGYMAYIFFRPSAP